MFPVSPVLPSYQEHEIVLGANQPEYTPLPAVVLESASQPMITRWRTTQEERDMIANGADIILQQLTFKSRFQPVNLQVVMPDGLPDLVE